MAATTAYSKRMDWSCVVTNLTPSAAAAQLDAVRADREALARKIVALEQIESSLVAYLEKYGDGEA